MRLTPLAPIAFVLAAVAPATAATPDERGFMLSGFDRVRIEGPFEVTVTTAPTPSAKATGDSRALDGVSIRVDGRTLVVAPGINGWGGYPGAAIAKPTITITVPALRAAALTGGGRLRIDRMVGQRVELSLTGAGTIDVADVAADRLEATLIGTGALTVAGRAIAARFQSNGAGTIAAGGLQVRALVVNSQGSGDASFAASDTAQVFADGRGSVRVAGAPACTVRGAATIACGTGR